jgi:hypothetical protein
MEIRPLQTLLCWLLKNKIPTRYYAMKLKISKIPFFSNLLQLLKIDISVGKT